MSPLTLEDVAKISGVSRSTVSRVMNCDPNVKEETRDRVNKILTEMNFQPNIAARGLAAGKTQVLGVLIPTGVNAFFSDPYFPLLIQGVTSACNQHDHSVMLWIAEPAYEQRTIRQILHSGLVDGVIIASNVMDDPVVEALLRSRKPFIMVGRHPTNNEVNFVDVDNRSGAREATTHLIRQGRRRIATITGPMNMIAGADRFQGYLDALHDRGMPIDPNLVVEGDFTEASGFSAAQQLLSQNPDAIFVASDPMAAGVLRGLQLAGIKVPEQIAIVGFDDVSIAARTMPPLTTIRQPTMQTGVVAAETLIDIIEHGAPQTRRIILPTELVIRASCGAVHN